MFNARYKREDFYVVAKMNSFHSERILEKQVDFGLCALTPRIYEVA